MSFFEGIERPDAPAAGPYRPWHSRPGTVRQDANGISIKGRFYAEECDLLRRRKFGWDYDLRAWKRPSQESTLMQNFSFQATRTFQAFVDGRSDVSPADITLAAINADVPTRLYERATQELAQLRDSKDWEALKRQRAEYSSMNQVSQEAPRRTVRTSYISTMLG